MKVILVSHHFPPHYNAGGEQYAYRIAKGLQQQGHDVEIVCIESISTGTLTPVCKTAPYDNLMVHRLYFDLRQAPDQLEWRFRNPELGRWLKEFLQKSQPDLVHINSGYLLGGTAFEAAFELNLPTVLTLHDYWFLCPEITLLRRDGKICDTAGPAERCIWCQLSQKRRYRLPDQYLQGRLGDVFTWLSQSKTLTRAMGLASQVETMEERQRYLKQIFEKVDLVISPSQFLIEKMKAYGWQPRRIVHLPLGIKLSSPPLSQPRPLSNKLRIGYLGQLAPHKGVHILLAAFKELKKRTEAVELSLYGRTAAGSTYEQQLLNIAGNDPAITFAGPYPNSQVGQILSQFDVVVVPSIWYENRPAVIIEALATQTPVVASRLGGIVELIKHNENGLLFEAGSAAELSTQLLRLIDQPELLLQLRQGIDTVPTLEEELSGLTSLYRSLLPVSFRKTLPRSSDDTRPINLWC